MQNLPFSVWDHLYINLIQLISIYILIAFASFWLLEKIKFYFFSALITLMFIITIRSIHFSKAYTQEILFVYNVPQHQAIDLVERRKYTFIADSIFLENILLQNQYLQSARIAYRTSAELFVEPPTNHAIFQLHSKKILVIDQSVTFELPVSKINADIIIISKNPSISIRNLSKAFNCRQWIFDSSNSVRKINEWKKQCEQLGLSYHAVVDKGAFVMNLD